MQQEIDNLVTQAEREILAVEDLASLDAIRVGFLGKKGSLTALLKGVSKLPKDQRPLMGQAVNEAKRELSKKISKQQDLLQQALLEKQLKSETLDTSLPGSNHSVGSVHPVTQVK